jgi:hypothetical protein
MNLRTSVLLIIILAATPLYAREKADTIVMKNGDKITCEVKGLASNTLYISVDYILNTLSVDWTKVDHIESRQLFLIRTENGEVYTGAISTPEIPGGRPVEIEVSETPDKKTTLEKKQIARMDETAASSWQRWNGQLGTGSSYTKGNESSQYNLNSSIGYVAPRWSAGASYNSSLAASSRVSASTRNEVSFQGQHLLKWNNWYYTGIVDLLQSSVQGIQLQNSFGGGIGRNLVNTGSTFLTLYGGFAWQQINYQQAVLPASTQHVTAGLVGTELRLFRFDKTTLSVSANLLPAISQPGRVHFNLNTSYYVKLWGKLNWNFTLYGNWDNQPPPGFSTSDYGTTSGLSINFGNPLHQ